MTTKPNKGANCEKPILFSGPMVRAIIEGRKTQTRRVVKPQPTGGDTICPKGMDAGWIVGRLRDSENAWRDLLCPYGKPGDRLWVKETFGQGYYESFGETVEGCYRYRATEPNWNGKWKPSIHMPRWASRLTLEITHVRCERLQEISEEDAKAEGVTIKPSAEIAARVAGETPARMEFWHLWQSINGADSWAANPWVWVIEFRKL